MEWAHWTHPPLKKRYGLWLVGGQLALGQRGEARYAQVKWSSAAQREHIMTGHVRQISVDREHIHIEGEYTGAPLVVQVYADDEPAASAALQAGAFAIRLPRFHQGRDRLYARFSLHAGDSVLPGVCYAGELRGIAAYDYPYPQATTIKGLQVRDVPDALQLGIAHAALNLNQPTIMRPRPDDSTITYRMDNQEFYFDGAYLAGLDQRVKELSDHGVIVYLILLNSRHWDGVTLHPDLAEALVHPDYDAEGFISAFNLVTESGRAHYRAFVEFVAERYSRADQAYGRVSGYIIGNEVDAQWIWSNAGEKSVEAYMQEYALAVRTAFYAARKQYSQARVYLSLTHHWTLPHTTNPLRTYAGRDIIEIMSRLSAAEGDFDWSLAYHPYPQDLTIPRFWEDDRALDALDTPLITFKNIEVLPRYMAQPHLLYGGRMRHLILSEQGLNSDETEESERIQAAAYALAYWKIEQTGGIEAFIYHAHVDHRDEFGLNLGIRRRDKSSDSPNAPGVAKLIYAVFKSIDGPERESLLAAAQAVIGQENWR
jgi:hypothetical protein